MTRKPMFVFLMLLVSACSAADHDPGRGGKGDAKRYFRGVYSGDTTVIDDLAADDIVITYPIFTTLLGQSCVRGREAARAFVARFARKWAEVEITIHEVVAEHDTMVLVWSFRARDAMASSSDDSASASRHAWGGLTVVRFNSAGRVVVEFGEESEPGPMARLQEKPGG